MKIHNSRNHISRRPFHTMSRDCIAGATALALLVLQSLLSVVSRTRESPAATRQIFRLFCTTPPPTVGQRITALTCNGEDLTTETAPASPSHSTANCSPHGNRSRCDHRPNQSLFVPEYCAKAGAFVSATHGPLAMPLKAAKPVARSWRNSSLPAGGPVEYTRPWPGRARDPRHSA
jgi:hypothetical protein